MKARKNEDEVGRDAFMRARACMHACTHTHAGERDAPCAETFQPDENLCSGAQLDLKAQSDFCHIGTCIPYSYGSKRVIDSCV